MKEFSVRIAYTDPIEPSEGRIAAEIMRFWLRLLKIRIKLFIKRIEGKQMLPKGSGLAVREIERLLSAEIRLGEADGNVDDT